MLKPTIEIRLADLKPIRCKRRLKGTWQSWDALNNRCSPLALAAGEVVFDWNGGGGPTGCYELMGKKFTLTEVRVVISGHQFDADAFFLNGRGIIFGCMDCGTRKKLAGARYLVSTHNMGVSALSRFLLDKVNFT